MNDPRITQYALGELSGPERDQFERELAASETLQHELNETIPIAEALGKLPMSTDTLTNEQKSEIKRHAANRAGQSKKSKIGRYLVWGAVTAAAATVVVSLLFPSVSGSLQKASSSRNHTAEAPSAVPPAPGVALPAEQLLADNSIQEGTIVSADKMAQGPTDYGADGSASAMEPAEDGRDIRGRIEPNSQQSTVVAADEAEPARRGGNEMPASLPVPAQVAVTTAPAQFKEELDLKAGESPALAGAMTSSGFASVGGKIKSDSIDTDIPMVGRLFRAPNDGFNTEAYDSIQENVFLAAKENPLSTFSIDVDTASYANVRRFLQSGQRPPAGAIRTEELINYFTYSYPQPEGKLPFSVNLEVSRAPWDPSRELVRIGLKGREIDNSQRGPANLVFLLDVSGSMNDPDKLPLLKKSLQALVENLSPEDRVAIAVYAGSSGLVLPSTSGKDKARILQALENLEAGGSTNGASGIRLAYQTAREHFLKEGNNRVILCTDGDFNVGVTNQSELIKLIEEERASGVFLSVLGFGTGNLKDSTMEKLADKGNGNYAYIDSLNEGRKVLVDQMGATLFTIAKDVKIQVEFNPARVAGYRLVGYENRLLAKEDFNDDKKDAGEIGAGHTVTALYEIIPAGQSLPGQPSVDPLKYQQPEPVVTGAPKSDESAKSDELLTVKLRYKAPDAETSELIEMPLPATKIPSFDQASEDFRFASAVAGFGMKLRGSPDAGDLRWADLQKIVRGALSEDPGSYRAEFLTLIEKASRLEKDRN